MAKQETIGFIGGGNMAEAIVRGLLAAGTPASAVTVAEPRAARRRQLAKRFGVGATDDSAVAADARTLLLAVKPQTLPAVFDELGGRIGKRTVVVSIAAGVRLAKLERGLGRGTRVVRCMPNTPCLVGRGASVLCAGKAATRADLARARRIFDTVGIVRTVERESLLDAVTALSGSGPAYVYRFAEALVRAGRRAGLDADLAADLAIATVSGAGEMLTAGVGTPEQLRVAVSSPGGTTLAGLERFDEGDLDRLVEDVVRAAKRRSQELARG